jgi:hypothetical protein
MYAQYLSDYRHFIKSMEDIMDVLQITRQGIIINTFVKFHIYIYIYIYNETKLNNQINDK